MSTFDHLNGIYSTAGELKSTLDAANSQTLEQLLGLWRSKQQFMLGWSLNPEHSNCRILSFCTRSGWFKHSEPPRAYTLHTSTELARCVGCFCTSTGLLKHSEPPRTYRKHTTTELARCVGCFCTTSGWFKHIEPTRTTPSQRGVGCLCTREGWFKHSEPHRTYTLLTITELARCVGCLSTRSGWFKHIEPTRTTPSQL